MMMINFTCAPSFLSLSLSHLYYASESSKWEKKYFGLLSQSTFRFGFTPNSRYMAL